MIFLELFFTFLKIGAFTFGGGYAMLPLIIKETTSHGWVTMDELTNFVAVSESTPGPFAVNIATYIGSETGGVFGSFCATLGVVLPSFVIILLVAKFYLAFKNSRVVKGCMTGLRPVTVGLIGAAVLTIGQTVFFSAGFSISMFVTPAFLCSAALCVVATMMGFKKVHPILIITLSAAVGIGLGYLGVWG
jgi:chromate transporter